MHHPRLFREDKSRQSSPCAMHLLVSWLSAMVRPPAEAISRVLLDQPSSCHDEQTNCMVPKREASESPPGLMCKRNLDHQGLTGRPVDLQAGGVLCYSSRAPSLMATCGPIVAHATAADVLQLVDTAAAATTSATLAVRCTIELMALGAAHVALCGGGQVSTVRFGYILGCARHLDLAKATF